MRPSSIDQGVPQVTSQPALAAKHAMFEISNVLICWAVQALKPAVGKTKQNKKPEMRTTAHRQALAFWFILPLQVALHLIVDGFIQAQRLSGGDHRAAMPTQVFSPVLAGAC